MTKLTISARTHTGIVREHNEDSFIVSGNALDENWVMPHDVFEVEEQAVVMVVADGMGGENAGEVASEIAVQSIRSFLSNKFKDLSMPDEISGILESALIFANNNIRKACVDHPEYIGMGTTAIIAVVYKNKLYISWVGDSRAYRYSPHGRVHNLPYYFGNLEILSEDHSKVWGQVQQNQISPEEARVHPESNVITQSLGDLFRVPHPESRIYPIFKDDIILICSDGLNGMLSDQQINDIISEHKADLFILSEKLIEQANENGGHDNTTIITCSVVEGNTWTAEAAKEEETSKTERISKGRRRKISPTTIAAIIILILFSVVFFTFIVEETDFVDKVFKKQNIELEKVEELLPQEDSISKALDITDTIPELSKDSIPKENENIENEQSKPIKGKMN